MKQSILFRLCRQRQEMCFVELICFPYVPAMDCSSCYKACLMVCFSHIFYLHGNNSTIKSFFFFCCCFLKIKVFSRNVRHNSVTGNQHVTVAKPIDKVVVYELLRIKSKRV